MNFNEYQKRASQTAHYREEEKNKIIYPTLGLAGEAGEVAEKVKKILRDKNWAISVEDRKELEKELGDVLWYISQIALDLGITLESVAKTNLEKLASRNARGAIKGSGDNR